MTLPEGVSRGSTTTLKDVVPTNVWSRTSPLVADAPLIGRGVTPSASEVGRLSSKVQVAPPSIDRRKPTPGEFESPSPVAAKMIVCRGSLFLGKTAMEPMLSELVGPKSVRGIQVGPIEAVVRKFVVFQTPPLAP